MRGKRHKRWKLLSKIDFNRLTISEIWFHIKYLENAHNQMVDDCNYMDKEYWKIKNKLLKDTEGE